jgi:hypothetical protein
VPAHVNAVELMRVSYRTLLSNSPDVRQHPTSSLLLLGGGVSEVRVKKGYVAVSIELISWDTQASICRQM